MRIVVLPVFLYSSFIHVLIFGSLLKYGFFQHKYTVLCSLAAYWRRTVTVLLCAVKSVTICLFIIFWSMCMYILPLL